MGNRTKHKITSTAEVTTLAGTVRVQRIGDGVGTAATFNLPWAVTTDSAGNVYVADVGDIRKITPPGDVTTLAGTAGMSGHADCIGTAAWFAVPRSVATDNMGNIYVADSESYTIRKITQEGAVTTLAGTAGVPGHAAGTGAAERFNSPRGVATDSDGNIYDEDFRNKSK